MAFFALVQDNTFITIRAFTIAPVLSDNKGKWLPFVEEEYPTNINEYIEYVYPYFDVQENQVVKQYKIEPLGNEDRKIKRRDYVINQIENSDIDIITDVQIMSYIEESKLLIPYV